MRIREVRQKAQTEVNIKAEDGDRGAEDGDLATIMLSDGGLANPAFPSHDGIAPCGPSVSYSYAYSSPQSSPHIDTYSILDSPPHSDTHSLPYSDMNPHNDSHGNLIPCKMSFATQFIASSGNDCLKIQTDFEEAFVEAFPNIVKEHLCNNEQLSKSKVTNKELIEDNATLFMRAILKLWILISRYQHNLRHCYGMPIELCLVVFIKMMKDLLINLEEFNVRVMHYVC